MAKTKAKPKQDNAPAPESVTVISVSDALTAYNNGDIATLQKYCDIAGKNALKGIVAMRDELLQKG